MSDDGWDDDYVDDGSYDDGPYDDYAGDGGYDDGPCEDYTGDRGDCDEQDVGTTGYAEVEEVNDDNYRNAEGDNGGGDDEDVGTAGYAEEVDAETTGYAEVEEVGNDNCSNAEGNNDNDHDDRTSSDLVQNADRDQDQAEGNDEDGPSMSNYEYVKPWGGMHGFMRSYGIAREPGGYEEAGELRDAMMEAAHKNRNLKG